MRCVVAVAKTANFTRAADAAGRQPALSHQIARLERELGAVNAG